MAMKAALTTILSSSKMHRAVLVCYTPLRNHRGARGVPPLRFPPGIPHQAIEVGFSNLILFSLLKTPRFHLPFC